MSIAWGSGVLNSMPCLNIGTKYYCWTSGVMVMHADTFADGIAASFVYSGNETNGGNPQNLKCAIANHCHP